MLASPKPTQNGWQLTKSGNLEHTDQPASSSTCWWVSLPSDAVVLTLFQGARLASASSCQLVWFESSLQLFLSECDSQQFGTSEFGPFQWLPEPIFELFSFWLKELPCRVECGKFQPQRKENTQPTSSLLWWVKGKNWKGLWEACLKLSFREKDSRLQTLPRWHS